MNSLEAVKETQQMVTELLNETHYAHLGRGGIMAVVSMAHSLKIDPLRALNGGLYYVKGKVEMSAAMMNSLIRQNRHSITKDKKSDATICILHGKRQDNGDTWVASFSIEDAKKAGLINFKNSTSPWIKYTEDMLYARALSRIARQLFPDVICGCYVEGEISSSDIEPTKPTRDNNKRFLQVTIDKPVDRPITTLEYEGLLNKLSRNIAYKEEILEYFKKRNKSLKEMSLSSHDRIITKLESMPYECTKKEKLEIPKNTKHYNIRTDEKTQQDIDKAYLSEEKIIPISV